MPLVDAALAQSGVDARVADRRVAVVGVEAACRGRAIRPMEIFTNRFRGVRRDGSSVAGSSLRQSDQSRGRFLRRGNLVARRVALLRVFPASSGKALARRWTWLVAGV